MSQKIEVLLVYLSFLKHFTISPHLLKVQIMSNKSYLYHTNIPTYHLSYTKPSRFLEHTNKPKSIGYLKGINFRGN